MQRRMRRYMCVVGSHARLHLQVPLNWAYANCLNPVGALFVSRNAAFPMAVPSGTPSKLTGMYRADNDDDDVGSHFS